MRLGLLLTFLVFFCSPIFGQKHLNGLWKGKMFIGGLDGVEQIDFEMFLELDGRVVKGRSYVHLKSGELIEMNVKGAHL